MENLILGTNILLVFVIVGYGVHYLTKRFYHPDRVHFYRNANASLTVEREGKIVNNAEALAFISYAADDPFAIRVDYFNSRMYFEPHLPSYSVSVARDQVAHALATGTSRNLSDTADILAIFCSPSHLEGKGNTTFTWTAPNGSGDVHILTVPTKEVLKVVNASYGIVAPGEELHEPANNLDSVLDEILAGTARSSRDADED